MKLINALAPSWIEYEGARFQVKPLSQLGFIDVQNEINVSGKRSSISARGIETVLDECLLGWEGVTNATGEPIACNAASKRELPANVLVHIAVQVIRLSTLTEEQRKNS
jgi:hypothetical protein